MHAHTHMHAQVFEIWDKGVHLYLLVTTYCRDIIKYLQDFVGSFLQDIEGETVYLLLSGVCSSIPLSGVCPSIPLSGVCPSIPLSVSVSQHTS